MPHPVVGGPLFSASIQGAALDWPPAWKNPEDRFMSESEIKVWDPLVRAMITGRKRA